MRDEYVDGSAHGEAPHGPAPHGQPAGEMYPGNPRMKIDRGNPNPSDRDLRVAALEATREKRDHMKRDAGARMENKVTGHPIMQRGGRE